MRARALVLVPLLLAVACTGGDGDDGGPTPSVEVTAPAPVVDRSGISLAPVAGLTTTSIAERGTARLVGSVRGPTGPVAGATVRIERLVAGQERRTDVLTGPDGRFELTGAPGGRYRIRAFLAPTLAQTTAEVRFLSDAEEHSFDLEVQDHRGVVVRADAAPDPPGVGDPVNVVVLVASREVDADGIVRARPLPGTLVDLVGLGRWALRGDGEPPAGPSTTEPSSPSLPVSSRAEASARTDAVGRVRFELVCRSAGAPGLALRVQVVVPSPPVPEAPDQPSTTVGLLLTTETMVLELADCVAPAPSPTPAPAPEEPASTTPTSSVP